jgi:hypothetical protein
MRAPEAWERVDVGNSKPLIIPSNSGPEPRDYFFGR